MKKKPAPKTPLLIVVGRKKPGPKPTGRMTQVMCRMPPELVDRLDRYVGINRSDRSAAIREQLDKHLPR